MLSEGIRLDNLPAIVELVAFHVVVGEVLVHFFFLLVGEHVYVFWDILHPCVSEDLSYRKALEWILF